ncbi:MAG: ABC transporter substrate-binding protein, partial [candidate division NC10 bacterium]
MKRFSPRIAIAMGAVLAFGLGVVGPASAAETPQKGGILNFVVGSKIPSYDGHRETTFGVIHPIAPFYSVLIRVNPENPQSATDFVCDLCEGKVPTATEGGTKFTFKIRKGVKFHDGTPLTAADIKATFDKIIFPPDGIPSARKAFFKSVASVSAPSKYTVVFKLQFPSGAFIPALADPYHWVYSKKDLDEHGYKWHQKNINGSGPFIFVEHQPGSFVQGKRNPN